MNTQLFIKKTYLANPWIYFLATYLWSWSFFGLTYWLGLNGENTAIGSILVFLALSGPAVMAMIFIHIALDKTGQKDYWRRIIDYKRIPLKWYSIIVLFVPTFSIIAALLSHYWSSPLFFVNRLPSLWLLILVVPLAPILEELGWRGYVLDRLQEKYSALSSSLILGVLWFFWHVPAFFFPGGMLGVMPIASLSFWLYAITLVILSVYFTWIYNNTNRSTLAAILFHIMIEFSANAGLIPFDQPEHLYNVVLLLIIAIGITVVYGARTLKKD